MTSQGPGGLSSSDHEDGASLHRAVLERVGGHHEGLGGDRHLLPPRRWDFHELSARGARRALGGSSGPT